MKKMFLLMIVMKTTSSFADVELITRNNPEGSYSKGAYSFYSSTQDVNVTHNSYDIMFEDRADFDGYFETQMVVDQVGKIVDLGKTDCTALQSDGTYDRLQKPYNWLYRSNMFDKLGDAKSKSLVNEGHCYLIDRVNSDQRVLAFFHVKQYTKNRSVILDQIEIMGRFELIQKP